MRAGGAPPPPPLLPSACASRRRRASVAERARPGPRALPWLARRVPSRASRLPSLLRPRPRRWVAARQARGRGGRERGGRRGLARPGPARPAAARCLAAGLRPPRRGARERPRPARACGLRADGRLPGPPLAWAAGRGSVGRPAGAGCEALGRGFRRGAAPRVWEWRFRRAPAPVTAWLPPCPSKRKVPEPLRWVRVAVAPSGCYGLEWSLRCAFSFFLACNNIFLT